MYLVYILLSNFWKPFHALMGRPTGLEPANAGATIQSVNQLHHGRHIWLAHVILSYFWVFVNRYNPILFSPSFEKENSSLEWK